MSLYRGAGGASDATDDSTVSAVAGYAASAASSATSAATSATNANSSSSTATTAASTASTGASTATTQASNASTSATSAAASATTATTQASNASTSATNAATSASTASTSANNAASSASTATTQATAAASSATAAASSAASALSSKNSALAIYGNTTAMYNAVDAAAASATTATTQATLAGTRATAAAESATAANDAATVASGWATSAQNSANTAQSYITSINVDVSTAATAATEAAASATVAANAANSASAIVGSGNGIFGSTPISTSGTLTLTGVEATGVGFFDGSNILRASTSLTYDGLGYLKLTTPSLISTEHPLTVASPDGYYGGIYCYTTDSYAANIGGQIILGGMYYNASSNNVGFGGIGGRKENASALDLKGYLQFNVHNGSGYGEVGRFTSTGNFGIGVTSPTAKLDVAGTAKVSGAVTLSGGTANGVAYLNGSKVLTTGSALTFDGTNFSVSGGRVNASTAVVGGTNLGDTSQFVAVNTNGAVGDFSGIRFNYYNSGDSGGKFGYIGTVLTSVASSGLADMVFGVKSSSATTTITEQMRLTSTGLGIGTSSPAVKLNVSGGQVYIDGTDSAEYLRFRGATIGFVGGIGSTAAYIGTYTSHALQFATGNTVKATLDSSGNLGLGVAPSAWTTSYAGVAAMQIGTNGASLFGTSPAWSASPYFYISNNAYNNAGWKYKVAQASAQYVQSDNTHYWNISTGTPSAGGAISFTQAMTLDASGNLLVGCTGWDFANNGTQIAPSGRIFNTSSTDYNMELAGAQGGRIRFYTSAGGSATTVGSITVSTSATFYNVTSDQRLKENIVDSPEFGSIIDAIQVRQFDWKADGSHQRYGFIAQELVTVAPEAVHQPANEEDMMAVDYSKLVPMLVKEIQSLRQRLAALEAK